MPEFTFDGGYTPGGPQPFDRQPRSWSAEPDLDRATFRPAPRPDPVPSDAVPDWNPRAGLTVRNKLTGKGPYVLVQRHASPPGIDLPVLVPSVEDRQAYKVLKVDDAWVVRNRRDEDLVIPTACLEPYEKGPGTIKRLTTAVSALVRAIPKELVWMLLTILLSLASCYGMLSWGTGVR